MSAEPVLYKYQAVESWRFLSRFIDALFFRRNLVVCSVYLITDMTISHFAVCERLAFLLSILIAEDRRAKMTAQNFSSRLCSLLAGYMLPLSDFQFFMSSVRHLFSRCLHLMPRTVYVCGDVQRLCAISM